ncbi:MAG: SAF domain-containing protein [Clostridium sp.]|nr:SAF domain-containing protein [Clostridium sp.]MCM1443873.1 SAF domain-containing protein [Candidatus Amulumruptor caecigallinarius]
MNNFMRSLKKFFKNKNTVTIIGVILIVALLYFGYTYQINTQTKPTRVPVAAATIQPRTKITADMIKYIEVPGASISNNTVMNANDIIDMYANYNTVIPEGSLFYKEALATAKEMPDSAFVDIKQGDIPYQFAVTMESTYGNSIFPGNQIDLYMEAMNENGEVIVGKFIENVEVLAVKDSSGNHVFENTAENRTPAYIIFGVNDELNILLLKAKYLSSVTVFPVPHGAWKGTEGQIQVSSEELKAYINERTVMLSDTELLSQEVQ